MNARRSDTNVNIISDNSSNIISSSFKKQSQDNAFFKTELLNLKAIISSISSEKDTATQHFPIKIALLSNTINELLERYNGTYLYDILYNLKYEILNDNINIEDIKKLFIAINRKLDGIICFGNKKPDVVSEATQTSFPSNVSTQTKDDVIKKDVSVGTQVATSIQTEIIDKKETKILEEKNIPLTLTESKENELEKQKTCLLENATKDRE